MSDGITMVGRAIWHGLSLLEPLLVSPNGVAAVLGFFLGILAEPLRNRLLGPKLCLEFQKDDDRYVAEDAETRITAVRVSVRNPGRSDLEDCRVHIVGLTYRSDKTAPWQPTTLSTRLS
jgi:hypothetical protein